LSEIQSKSSKPKAVLAFLSSIPVILCALLFFYYDSKNPDSALAILGAGMLIVCIFSPLYLAILSGYFSMKKQLQLGFCSLASLLANFLANCMWVINLGVTTGWTSSMILWILPFVVGSMIIMVICLKVVGRIKKRYDKKARNTI
jgi:hypothetical protein